MVQRVVQQQRGAVIIDEGLEGVHEVTLLPEGADRGRTVHLRTCGVV
jgi:hypothetical protein